MYIKRLEYKSYISTYPLAKKKKKESIEHKTNEDRNPRDTSDLWMGQTGPRKQTNKG